MINKNIGMLHNAIMTFKSISDLEKYKYISDLETGSTILLMGKETEGDSIIQQRQIAIENDEDLTGVQLMDSRWAILVGELIPVKPHTISLLKNQRTTEIFINENFFKNENGEILLENIDVDNFHNIILLSPPGETLVPPTIFPQGIENISIKLNTGELCEFFFHKEERKITYKINSECVLPFTGLQAIVEYK